MGLDISNLKKAQGAHNTMMQQLIALNQKTYDALVALRDQGDGATQAEIDAITRDIEAGTSAMGVEIDATDDDPNTPAQPNA